MAVSAASTDVFEITTCSSTRLERLAMRSASTSTLLLFPLEGVLGAVVVIAILLLHFLVALRRLIGPQPVLALQ